MDGAPLFKAPPDLAAGLRVFLARAGAPHRLLIAVSGGSDSMALMRLAARLAENGEAAVSVATVDHGLRAASRLEAATVGAAARDLGLDHAILAWAGEKPKTGLQTAARRARYLLLVRHAHEIGAEAIMTAHTADDQAETVAMRLARRSGPRGLSAMREDAWIAAGASTPIRLLRPLLGVRRQALRDFLTAEGAGYFDDPSNDDPSFERVRVRRRLAGEGVASGAHGALIDTARRMRIDAALLEAAENERFAALGGAFDCWGGARLSSAPGASDAGLIARLIASISGGDYPPNETKAAKALARARSGRHATLGGVMLVPERGRLLLTREPAAVFGREGVGPLNDAEIAPGATILWDNRHVIANRFDAAAAVSPLDAGEARSLGFDEAAIAGPVLRIAGDIVAIPGESDAFTPLAAERFYQRVNRFY